MKNVFRCGFFILLASSYNQTAYSQLLKQYVDSAIAYESKNNIDNEIEFYFKTREELKKDSGNTNSYAQICMSLGKLCYLSKQYNRAKNLYLEAKQIIEKLNGKFNTDYVTACDQLGRIYSELKESEKAEPFFLESKRMNELISGNESIDYAVSCNELAIHYKNTLQFEKAELLYLESRGIIKKRLGNKHSVYTIISTSLYLMYYQLDLFKKAEATLLEVKKLTGKENPDYAGYCYNLGTLYIKMRQHGKAEAMLLEAKQMAELFDKKGDIPYAQICNNLAAFYQTLERNEDAAEFFIESKSAYIAAKDSTNYSIACDNLANLYLKTGQYMKAEPLYFEAKQIRTILFGKRSSAYAASCENLANFFYETGNYEEAKALLFEAKQITEQYEKNTLTYAANCNNIARLYYSMGNYEEVESLWLKARQIIKESLDRPDPMYASAYASVCKNLSVFYQLKGKVEMAKSQPGKAGIEYGKAANLLGEAANIDMLDGIETLKYADDCNRLGSISMDLNDYVTAKTYLVKAKMIRQKILGVQHRRYGTACHNLALLFWNVNQLSQADNEFRESFSADVFDLNCIFDFVNEKEKKAFIKNVLGENEKTYSFYLSERVQSGLPYDLSLFHRNLILSSLQNLKKQIFNSNDTTLHNKYIEWLDTKAHLSAIYSLSLEKRKENLSDLERQVDELEKELTRLSSKFKKHQKKENWKEVQDKLKSNEAAIEFTSFKYYKANLYTDSIFYVALVLRKDRPTPELVYLFEKKQLNALLNNANVYETDSGKINFLYKKTVALYDLAWKPLEEHLSSISKIYFAAAGDLFKLSFAALSVNDTQLLSDKYHLIQLNTTASVTDQTEDFIKSSDQLKLYGGINYDADPTSLKNTVVMQTPENGIKNTTIPDDLFRGDSWGYLKGTRREVTEIDSLGLQFNYNNIDTSFGIDATEESVKALNGKKSPVVLHIATHGFFFPDPKVEKKDIVAAAFEKGEIFKQSEDPLFRSGLLFAGGNAKWNGKTVEGIEDGILTSYEVANLYLPNTKLAVLSACETGLGDIQGSEGVYGLQRAFNIAGVQNLVMSLWKVPDSTTSKFMQLFYKNMFEKQSISDAFYNAQTTMKNKYRNEPYKWAAWILVR